MTRLSLVEKTFSLDEQERFAQLSGDRNPIHLDPVEARRSFTKRPIVHGVHAMLWGLEGLYAHVEDAPALISIRVRFEKMIPVGVPAAVYYAPDTKGGGRLDIVVAGAPALVALLTFGDCPGESGPIGGAPKASGDTPLEPSLDDMRTAHGRVGVAPSADDLRNSFPALFRRLGALRIAGLMTCSYIVGMLCPGRHSIFRSLKLTAAPRQSHDGVTFKATSLDERFRIVKISVDGCGWNGSLEAHVAPEPAVQPLMAHVARHVEPGEFSGVSALVIGGSRGLGELAAKIVAAGGGDVVLTYRAGEDDARRVQSEIAAAGARARVMRYDVLHDDPQNLSAAAGKPNQLYYMATPPITSTQSTGLDDAKLETYLKHYVFSFYDLSRRVAESVDGAVSVFYPSTIFLDAPGSGFTEYVMAKAAGEALCAEMRASKKFRSVITPRLPRLPTDQTLSLAIQDWIDPLELLVPIARRMTAQPPLR